MLSPQGNSFVNEKSHPWKKSISKEKWLGKASGTFKIERNLYLKNEKRLGMASETGKIEKIFT